MKVYVNKDQQIDQVDWTKNPQLVIAEDGEIVLVHEYQKDAINLDSFVGTRLNVNISVSKGWNKRRFKPFHGSITLLNNKL